LAFKQALTLCKLVHHRARRLRRLLFQKGQLQFAVETKTLFVLERIPRLMERWPVRMYPTCKDNWCAASH
jgi:hypothetical protein